MRTAAQLSYLEALDIPVWVRKGMDGYAAGTAPGLQLGPGSGRYLLLCEDAAGAASQLAADVARALSEQPVWGWPAGDGLGPGPEAAVDEGLFTTVLVFGQSLATTLFGRAVPGAVGPAVLLVVPAMAELAGTAAARRDLWAVLRDNRLVVAP